MSNEEVELLKNTICKGITDAEFAMFLWVAKKHKLDPMTRQLHAVKRYVQKHHQDEKGIPLRKLDAERRTEHYHGGNH